MKPLPCLPVNSDLERQAHEAEQRKHDALDELLMVLSDAAAPPEDEFERQMRALIEADHAALAALENRKRQ